MHKIHAAIELSDEMYRSLEKQARELGLSAQRLIERILQGLVERLNDEREAEEDHPIFFS